MRVHQMPVDPRLRLLGKKRRVDLTYRDEHLTLLSVDHVAVDVHVRELAAEAKRFEGAELLYTSLPASSVTQLSEAFGNG